MQDSGQEPVGQGEDGPPAGARCGQPGAVAAAFAQAGFPLLVVQHYQCCDQGVPLPGWQPGQCRVAEPGQIGAGSAGRIRDTGGLVVVLGAQGVVPVAVPVVAGQRQRVHLRVADLDPGVVGAGVQVGAHPQPGAGRSAGDGLHDDLVAAQQPAAPVHRDVGEQPVLDLVPLRRGPGREMADGDLQPGFHGQRCQLGLPRPGAVAVGAARIRGDQQPPGQRIVAAADRFPPAADRLHGERGGVVVGADGHPAGVAGEVIHPVGTALPALS